MARCPGHDWPAMHVTNEKKNEGTGCSGVVGYAGFVVLFPSRMLTMHACSGLGDDKTPHAS